MGVNIPSYCKFHTGTDTTYNTMTSKWPVSVENEGDTSNVSSCKKSQGCRQSVYQTSLQIISQVWETLSASVIDPDAIVGLGSIFDDSFDLFMALNRSISKKVLSRGIWLTCKWPFRRTLVCMCLCVCISGMCVCHTHVCLPYMHGYTCKYSYTCMHIFLQTCMLIPLFFPLHMQEPKELPLGDAYYVPALSGNKRRLVQKRIHFSMFQYIAKYLENRCIRLKSHTFTTTATTTAFRHNT